MLEQSFVILPRVGARSERALWLKGVGSWSDFLANDRVRGFSKARKDHCDWRLRHARERLRADDSRFFAQALPFSDQWRLYSTFDNACFLDIETDGYYGGVTVVGISDGVDAKSFVRGFNLERDLIERELARYDLVVTFNGASFDFPVLRRYFKMDFDLPHVDLRFVCAKAGYAGGLKSIEKQFGIRRRPEVEGVSGEDAVYLWQMWRSTGDREYLDKLVLYNEEDILNLAPIAKRVIPELWSRLRSI